IKSMSINRLLNLMNQTDEDNIIYGGKSDESTLKIEPTLLHNVTWNDESMEEEIFGPILPILTFTKIDEAISAINAQEKPLALYFFGKDKDIETKVLQSIRFGSGDITDT